MSQAWPTVRLDTVAQIRTGIAKGKPVVGKSIEVPYLRVANVQDGYLDLTEIKTLQVNANAMERYALQIDDVLLTEGGDFDKLGRGHIWHGQINPCLHQNHVFSVRVKKEKLNPQFLAYLTSSEQGRAYFLSCSKQSTNLASINSTQLKSFPVLLANLNEQHAIVECLQTWDKGIEKLQALISVKELRKQALMQRLLTGKLRLRGLNKPWRIVALGEVCEFHKGTGLSKDLLIANGLRKCILYGELYTRYAQVIREIASRTNVKDGVTSEAGDVLMPSSTTTRAIDLANATALHESNVLLGGDIIILRPDKKYVDSNFLAYFLTHCKKKQIASLAQGATIVHLYASSLEPLQCELPPITDQVRISEVLLNADAEITKLRSQLSNFSKQKKALQQQLLSGNTRLKM
jgi:type I restriction enzyme, S subunit